MASAQNINQARDAYNAGEYQEVVRLLEPVVGSEEPASDDVYLVQDSRRYLAAAYVLLDREADAESQFEWLLREIATDRATRRLVQSELESFRMDPARFLEAVQQVFQRVRGRLVTEAQQQQTDAQTSAAQQRQNCVAGFNDLRDLASAATIEVDNDELPAFVPFGVGQFANGDEVLGFVMAISQAAFAIGAFGSLSAYVYVESIGREESGRLMPGYGDALVGIQVANIITASIFVVLAAAGIIEARTSWRPTRTETQEREIPEELQDPVHLCGSPEAGIALCF